ncbi:hypothetical protein DFH09DRAFT_1325838 [Mycena vulgaris]|nr:hypothetical protein DFH09DRAFT_1325838 [Mycena vulgaris]
MLVSSAAASSASSSSHPPPSPDPDWNRLLAMVIVLLEIVVDVLVRGRCGVGVPRARTPPPPPIRVFHEPHRRDPRVVPLRRPSPAPAPAPAARRAPSFPPACLHAYPPALARDDKHVLHRAIPKLHKRHHRHTHQRSAGAKAPPPVPPSTPSSRALPPPRPWPQRRIRAQGAVPEPLGAARAVDSVHARHFTPSRLPHGAASIDAPRTVIVLSLAHAHSDAWNGWDILGMSPTPPSHWGGDVGEEEEDGVRDKEEGRSSSRHDDHDLGRRYAVDARPHRRPCRTPHAAQYAREVAQLHPLSNTTLCPVPILGAD